MPDLRALAERLRGLEPQRHHVVTLPDFYLDHFLQLPTWDETMRSWRAVHDRGGGNVATPGQRLAPGGNAANTALALARLGVRTHLVTRTTPFGRAYLEQTLGRAGVDLAHAHSDGHLSITTALEFHDKMPRNVMLSDAGSVASFGPDALNASDWTLVEAADLVLVANWSQNQQGTDLLAAVASKARRVMLDTGDPSVRSGALEDLRERVVGLDGLDIHGLNENELRQITNEPLLDPRQFREAAKRIHKRGPGGVLDLHTAAFSATYTAQGETVAPSFRIQPLRATGAGDAWNAGDILGHVAGFEPHERLLLANAVAALTITSPDGTPPTLAEVARFLSLEPTLHPL